MILVYAESPQGKFKKNSFEAVTYGRKAAEILGTECVALVLGDQVSDPGILGKYGASKVYQVADPGLDQLDSQLHAGVIAQAARKLEATLVVLAHTSTGKSLLGRLAVKLEAGSVSGVISLPESNDGLTVRKNVFSGKAIATYQMKGKVNVLSLQGNSIRPDDSGQEAVVEKLELEIPERKITVKEVKTADGRVPLPEAEKVVSGGRGLKGPENWGMLEDLAQTIGATLACSRPVADADWRPHHEHVGQTGLAIRPNLYIAVAISGAIQHLAGVNNSKVIVVINKDAEAPFFKAADYGVVGDAFEVVPRLTEALKNYEAD